MFFPRLLSLRFPAARVSPTLHRPHRVFFSTRPITTMASESPSHRLASALDPASLMQNTKSELFNYTTGQFLANNDLRLEERKCLFDILGLLAIISRTLNDRRKIVGFRKLGEGGLNRSFLVTLDDDFELVARIPYRILVPQAHTLASEVATMDFLRLKGVPIPKVYAYDFTPDNEAKTPYVIMELASGIDLSKIWFKIDDVQIRSLMDELAELERLIMSIQFDAGGSIYYVEDLKKLCGEEGIPLERENESVSPEKRRFCLGPDVSPVLWYGRRERLDVFRGPYKDAESVLVTGAKKELEYLAQFGTPRAPYLRYRRQFYHYEKQQPTDHARNLERYLLLAPSLVPKDESVTRFCIRHPDLNENNIRVSPDGLRIEGLLDWQHAVVLPRFLHAGVPNAIQIKRDEAPKTPGRPELPVGFEQLSKKDQLREMELLRRRRLHYYYVCSTEKLNKIHHQACTYPLNVFRRRIFSRASEMWEGESVNLQCSVIDMVNGWELFAKGDEPCPVEIVDDERAAAAELYQKLRDAEDYEKRLAGYVGYGEETWVPAADYEEARARAEQIRQLTLKAYDEDESATEKGRADIIANWPLDDRNEEELREYE